MNKTKMDFIRNGNYDANLEAFSYRNTTNGKTEQLHNFKYSKVSFKYKYTNPKKGMEKDRFLLVGHGDFYKSRNGNFVDTKSIKKNIIHNITDGTHYVISQEEMNDSLTIEVSL